MAEDEGKDEDENENENENEGEDEALRREQRNSPIAERR